MKINTNNFGDLFLHDVDFGLVLLVFSVIVVFFVFILKQQKRRKKAYAIIFSNFNGYIIWKNRNVAWQKDYSKIIEAEDQIKKYEQVYLLYEKWHKWGIIQSEFNKNCRSLMENHGDYGFYYYKFVSSQINELGESVKAEHPLWQFFIYAYSSYASYDEFEKKYFGFIHNNNDNIVQIRNCTYELSSDYLLKVVNLLIMFYNKYQDIHVLCLTPEDIIDKKTFISRYYLPIEEKVPAIKFHYLNSQMDVKQIENRFVVLLDYFSDENRQVAIAGKMMSFYKANAPYMIYLSIYKEYSNIELDKIIHKKREEIRIEKEEIISLIEHGYKHVENTQLEKAKEEFRKAANDIDDSELHDSEKIELQERLEETRNCAIIKYNDIETYENWNENIVVDYSTPIEFVQSNDWQYAVSMFPKKGSHVYPFRRGKKTSRVGHTERDFYNVLMNLLPKQQVEVKNDVYLVMSENKVRETDIALIILNHPSIKIDIEIDEPYEAGNRTPIHYISCGDDVRNDEFLRRGWIVIRFAEKQVKLYPKQCASYLARLVKALVQDFVIPKELECEEPLPQVKRWTQHEALLMAANKEREQYLDHDFKCVQEEVKVYVNFQLSEDERKCNNLIEKPAEDPEFARKMNSFKDAYRYERDKKIGFNALEHIYINKDNEELFLPVSSLISYFFEKFEAEKQAENQLNRYGIPIEESLTKWEKIGKIASEVGTFMHAQTENYFKKGFFDTVYHFRFKGCAEDVSIEKERQHFLDFIKDYDIESTLYRQEWPIYDDDLNIAGTIDLTCQIDKDTFTIYDWKRSGKVVNPQGQPIVEAFGGKRSINGVDLPDTAFYHYCMQQNLYRYMLEKNYGIHVRAMNLVVLCPDYPTYYVAQVPKMDEVISQIVAACHQKDLGHRLL